MQRLDLHGQQENSTRKQWDIFIFFIELEHLAMFEHVLNVMG